MARNYSATIPGNYITHWMNLFTKATEQKRYERIPYDQWKRLKQLSQCDKVRVECIKDPTLADLYSIKIGSLKFSCSDDGKSFCDFFSNLLSGKEGDPVEINWKPEVPTNMLTDEIHNILNSNKDITGSIYMNVDSVPTISTTSTAGSVTIPYGKFYNDYTNCITSDFDDFKEELRRLTNSVNELKEKTKEKSMNTNTNEMFNFDFGVVNDHKIRMSMYGYAIPNKTGKYVAYDVEHQRMMDVQILNFDCANMFYKIPKPLTKVLPGDVIFHNGVPMFVIYVDDARFTVIDPQEGTEKTILPSHSPFGFDYATCLVSLMDGFDMPADDENPFGNMLPLILMNNGQNSNQMLPLFLMMNGKLDMSNPMMLLALSGDNGLDMNNPFMAMALMKMFDK